MLGDHNSNTVRQRSNIGQVISGRPVARVDGGYIIESQSLPQKRGFVQSESNLAIGSEILVKIMGQQVNGLPLLYTVFGGFR